MCLNENSENTHKKDKYFIKDTFLGACFIKNFAQKFWGYSKMSIFFHKNHNFLQLNIE